MAETGSHLRLLRQQGNLTQEQLASALGVSRQTINAIEAGRFDPSLPLALRIAAQFGRPVEEIFWLAADRQ